MTGSGSKRLGRAAIAAAVAAVVGLSIAASRLFTLEEAQRAVELCRHAARAHPAAVFAGIALAQALGMAFSLPTKALLVLVAGALLGTVAGAAATGIGVISGTTALFFGWRRLFGAVSLSRFGALASRLERGLRERPALAVAGLRLVVTIPYGPITIASAASGMRYRDFALGSILGDLPVTALYALAGSRIASLVTVGEAISPATAAVLVAAGVTLFAGAVFGGARSRRGGGEGG